MIYIKINGSLFDPISDILKESGVSHFLYKNLSYGVVLTPDESADKLIRDFFGDSAILSISLEEKQSIESLMSIISVSMS